MNEQQISRIRKLVGQRIEYDGAQLLVHELLSDKETLVLMFLDRDLTIQNNQYGEPRRRVPELLSVSLGVDETGQLHPLVQFLLRQ